MITLEEEKYLYDTILELSRSNYNQLKEDFGLDVKTIYDDHIDRVLKSKDILDRKIKNTPKEARSYLERQRKLLDVKHKELDKRNKELKDNILSNLKRKQSNDFDPNNKDHMDIIKSYENKKMEHVRNSKNTKNIDKETKEWLNTIFNYEKENEENEDYDLINNDELFKDIENVTEMVSCNTAASLGTFTGNNDTENIQRVVHHSDPEKRAEENRKLTTRLIIASMRKEKNDRENIGKIARSNMVTQRIKARENEKLSTKPSL